MTERWELLTQYTPSLPTMPDQWKCEGAISEGEIYIPQSVQQWMRDIASMLENIHRDIRVDLETIREGADNYIDWTDYTPELGAGSGSLTTASVTARYKYIGDIVFVDARITITNKGTATGELNMTLPLGTPTNDSFGCGRECATTGYMLFARIPNGDAHCYIAYYDNTTAIGDGNLLVVSFHYNL